MNPQIKKINIQNLRGLENTTLEDVRLFNLIIGPSDIGKTTILESIFMSSVLNYAPGIINVNNFRHADTSTVEKTSQVINSMFKDFGEEDIKITVDIQNTGGMTYKNCIKLNKKIRDTADVATSIMEYAQNRESKPIKLKFQVSGELEAEFENIINIGQHGVVSSYQLKKGNNIVPEEQYLDYFPAATMQLPNKSSTQIKNIVVHKKKKEVIDVLQQINPKIISIDSTEDNIYIDIGLDSLMSIHSFGSGIREILDTLDIILYDKTKIILIDEIGRGVYYASLKNYLKSVLLFAKKQNKQIFATTHRKDVLIALQELAEEEKELQENIMCYSLSRTKSNIVKAYNHPYDELKHAIEHDRELR